MPTYDFDFAQGTDQSAISGLSGGVGPIGLLIVRYRDNNPGHTLESNTPTWNGVSMTNILATADMVGSRNRAAAWKILNPTAGTIALTFPEALVAWAADAIVVTDGVDVEQVSAVATGNTDEAQVNYTPAKADNAVLLSAQCQDETHTFSIVSPLADAGRTDSVGNFSPFLGYQTTTGTAQETAAAGISSVTDWGAFIVEVETAPAGDAHERTVGPIASGSLADS